MKEENDVPLSSSLVVKFESDTNFVLHLFPWQPDSDLCFFTHTRLQDANRIAVYSPTRVERLPAGLCLTARAFIPPSFNSTTLARFCHWPLLWWALNRSWPRGWTWHRLAGVGALCRSYGPTSVLPSKRSAQDER